MQETDILEQLNSQPAHVAYPPRFQSLLILPLFFIVFTIFSCSELSEYDSQQIQTVINDSLITTTESWDVEMVLTQDGQKRIYIEGSYAINYQEEQNKRTNISGPVYVQIFDSTGAIESEAWSKRAIYLEKEAEFELYDSVRVRTIDDRRLYTEFLRWTQNTDQITSPNFVTIITPTDSISGRGFEGVTDLSSYTIIEPRGRWMVE
jgi:LPS export ABC transporter protein LptC